MVEHWARHLFEQTNKGFISVYMFLCFLLVLPVVGSYSPEPLIIYGYEWVKIQCLSTFRCRARSWLVLAVGKYLPTLGQGLDPGMSSISEIFPFDGWRNTVVVNLREETQMWWKHPILHCRSPIFVDQFNSNQLVSWNLATQGSACVMALGSGTIHFWETRSEFLTHSQLIPKSQLITW